ncbi:DUF2188 domain-containing protein [Tahibacter caeni]|uniref:DUF2188 domain-containing protein n=1 Tax=Tahibacter caeni TaxID=1453545 RepID=UPI0021485350|nr:DUF2188 domain-containing protein [Tahibacter caeni]
MATRTRLEVTWSREHSDWVLTQGTGIERVGLSRHETKQDAVDAGAARGRAIMRNGGRAQLVVHLKDGTFDFERTYPDETPQRKG